MDENQHSDPVKQARFRTCWVGRNEWIIVPSARNWAVLPFLSLWLIGWTAGGFMAMGMLFAGPDRAFIALWLVAWVIGWIFASSMLAWQLGGQYRITITNGALLYEWSMPVLSRKARYDLAHIRDMQAAKHLHWPIIGSFFVRSTAPPFIQRFSYPNTAKSILFQYEGSKVTLYLGLTEKETEVVIEWLRRRAVRILDGEP